MKRHLSAILCRMMRRQFKLYVNSGWISIWQQGGVAVVLRESLHGIRLAHFGSYACQLCFDIGSQCLCNHDMKICQTPLTYLQYMSKWTISQRWFENLGAGWSFSFLFAYLVNEETSRSAPCIAILDCRRFLILPTDPFSQNSRWRDLIAFISVVQSAMIFSVEWQIWLVLGLPLEFSHKSWQQTSHPPALIDARWPCQ